MFLLFDIFENHFHSIPRNFLFPFYVGKHSRSQRGDLVPRSFPKIFPPSIHTPEIHLFFEFPTLDSIVDANHRAHVRLTSIEYQSR